MRVRDRRWIRRASFTVEASVILCMFLFIIAGFVDLSLKLYRESIEQIEQYQTTSVVGAPQTLRIRHLGGELYEQYRLQYNL